MTEKPIKVLAVVYKLMPAGLENRLMDIIRSINTQRVIIDVFTYQLEPGIYDDEVKALGGIVYYNPPLTIKNMFWYARYFCSFLKKHQEYKIVHAHQDAWCSVFCKGAYLAGVPVRIAHSRTAISTHSLSSLCKNIIKLPTRKYANFYFAVSHKAGRWLFGEKLLSQGRVQIWPNAIDARKFYFDDITRETVRKANAWEGRYVVMHVGNYTPPKNHPFILKVFNEIHKRDANSLLVLIGTGEQSFINSYIQEHKLETAIRILGSRTDVNTLLQGADVFLFPSVFEGLPGAMVEAQASGLPCVMSDSIAEEVCITPNVTALSLSMSVQKWADEVLSYRGFERKDTRVYIEAKGFDIEALVDKLSSFYENTYESINT